MPTISQLPSATLVTSEDVLPISQGGSSCSVSVGDLLASTQPMIVIPQSALLGRTSVGPGSPEQVGVGLGLDLSGGTIVATGADHARFPRASSLLPEAALVVCDNGSQKLMPAELLRGLFSAGDNISITGGGVISALPASSSSGHATLDAIADLRSPPTVSAGDLIPISHDSTAYAVSYSDLVNGLTIDEAPAAATVDDADLFWVGQGASSMVAQTFGAVWAWIAASLPRYRKQVVELSSSTVLSFADHNGRILVATAPDVVLTPNVSQMGSGFGCEVVTSASASLVWGGGIVPTDGNAGMGGNRHARIFAFSSGAGTTVMASIGSATTSSGRNLSVPGSVSGLALLDSSPSSLTLKWIAPATGASVSSYVVQYRLSGADTWTTAAPNPTLPAKSISGLTGGTAYDIQVAASAATGVTGAYSQLLSVPTVLSAASVPAAPTGLATTSASSTSIGLTWAAPNSGPAATGYSVQYSVDGGATWSAPVLFGPVSSGIVASLAPATTYCFRIAAVNAAGSSSYIPASAYPAAATVFGTSSPGLPSNVTAPTISATSVSLQWVPPSGPVTGYNVQYRLQSGGSWALVSVATPDVTITGLAANAIYEFQVQTVNGSFVSAYTASLTVTTTLSSPSIYKLTPAPTRQSPTAGWAGTVITTANGQPALGYNVSDNSALEDGGFSVPASVGFAWSASNSVVPTATNAGSNGLSLDGHALWFTWAVAFPSTPGPYYLWAIAKDSGGDVGGTCVSPTPFTLQ